MEPISIMAVSLATLVNSAIAPVTQAANDNAKTETKTEESIDNQSLFQQNSQLALIEPGDPNVALTQEESDREKKLAKWQKKQSKANLPKGEFTINASAYTAAADECGKSDGITASGVMVKEERTLACPPNFPFGTKIDIKGIGIRVCEDRGGAIKGNHVDIYVQTKGEAFQFGRRNLIAKVVQ